MLCCLNNNKKPHIQLQTAKNLINKWPWGLGPKESSPFHLAPAGPINPLSHFVSRVQRAPRLRLRTVPVALAWGRECATTKARQKTKREEEWQRGTREPRCQSIASTAKWGHFKHKKGEGLAHWQHDPRGSLQSPFPAGKLQVNSTLAAPHHPTPP